MNVIETHRSKDGKQKLDIVQDEDPVNPREWDNLGLIYSNEWLITTYTSK